MIKLTGDGGEEELTAAEAEHLAALLVVGTEANNEDAEIFAIILGKLNRVQGNHPDDQPELAF